MVGGGDGFGLAPCPAGARFDFQEEKYAIYEYMYDEMQSCNARNYLQLFAYAFFCPIFVPNFM